MPSKLDSLCLQVKNLQRQSQQTEPPNFELEPCTGPLWDVVAFLEARKLGLAGRSLLNALTGYRPLTEAQKALLQKVLAHLGHPEWLQPILEELESTLQALAHCNAECCSEYEMIGQTGAAWCRWP